MRDELPLRLMIAAYVAFLLVLIVIAIALARISTPGESGYLLAFRHVRSVLSIPLPLFVCD
jgi:hypothetical protein